jgi:hypothetical protein
MLKAPDRAGADVPTTAGRAAASRVFADRWLLARAGAALFIANARYWSTVAPLVRQQISRWDERARAIPDPLLRTLAMNKLRDERFNVEVAATLATLAPSVHRARVVEAIVALQVIYDYVDLLTEQPAGEPAIDGRRVFAALRDAVTLEHEDDLDSEEDRSRDYYRDRPSSEDGGYLQELVDTVSSALARLPSAAAITAVARASAARCAEAQVLNHEASCSGIKELRQWATLEASDTGLGWQEFLVGATASVLAIHALIAAAADPGTTREDAEELDALYLSIGALTVLDSVVDYQHDLDSGQPGFLRYYDDPNVLASRLAILARDAAARARGLPSGAHHIMTLVGVVAYYASAPTANSELARPLTAPIRRELRPLIAPTLALMRAWRLSKRVRRVRRFGGG